MSLERQDARCKLDPEDHAALLAICDLDRKGGAAVSPIRPRPRAARCADSLRVDRSRGRAL